MKLTKILAVAVVGLSIVSCGNSEFKTKKSLKTELDSVSYAAGIDMANKVKRGFEEVDQDLFVQGFKNGMDSTNLLVESKDINIIIRTYFQKKQQEKMKQQQAEQAKKAEAKFGDNKKAGEEFLAANKTKDGVITTDSGLQYKVLKEGNGTAPTGNQKVKVLYEGKLIDGETVFDKNLNREQPSEFGITQVIKGWTEGLKLMKPGAKYQFFIPQELAYGPQQRGKDIKPFSALVFEVELLEVVQSLGQGHTKGDGHGH